MSFRREIVFRARRKDTGEWIEGNYYHNIRKGEMHLIYEKSSNNSFEVYRESLQIKNYEDNWEEI